MLNRLQSLALPNNLQPQLSPWSPIGEIYRYQLTGPSYSLNEFKADAGLARSPRVKQVPGIIDITTFGGTTRQYQVEIDPNKLLAMGVTLPQVLNAIQNSNANAGGNYLPSAIQSVNVRGIGLLKSLADIEQHRRGRTQRRSGAGARCRRGEGRASSLGWGRLAATTEPDIVLGIVLLQKDEKSLPALKAPEKEN